MPLEILDKPVAELIEAIPNYSLGELETLLGAEKNGKTRKGAIAALEEAIAACEPAEAAPEPAESEEAPEAALKPDEPAEAPGGYAEVENIVRGSDITLHDGNHLLFGEKATVPAALAADMRKRGQVA